MRFFSSLCALFLLFGLCASVVASQQNPAMERRIRRIQQQQQRQQQNPADFAPDPPPVQAQGQPTPAPRPSPSPQAAVPTQPAAPQPTPQEQLPPPTPAQVTFRDGMLTVSAGNSSLNGLLTAIRNKTGIQFEGLESGASERVAINMGPAREADVLAVILGGSNFDYVVVERPDSPGIVQRVLLTPKGGAEAAAKNGQQPVRPGDADADEEEDAAEEPVAPQDTPVRPPVAQLPPQQPPQQPQQQQAPTAEQILQKLQQQQNSQQPQGVPPNTAPIKPH